MKIMGSVKSKIVLIVELILPWFIMFFAVPTFYYWNRMDKEWAIENNSEAYVHASNMCEFFFELAIASGVIIIIAEIVIGIISMVFMIISIAKKTSCVTYTMLVLLFCSCVCVFGTILLMLMTMVFTYGQGV